MQYKALFVGQQVEKIANGAHIYSPQVRTNATLEARSSKTRTTTFITPRSASQLDDGEVPDFVGIVRGIELLAEDSHMLAELAAGLDPYVRRNPG